MKKFILGKKIGMTQISTEDGNIVPVTVIQAGPCSVVSLLKKTETEGTVVLGYEERKEKSCNKPQIGFFKSIEQTPKRFLRGFKVKNIADFTISQVLDLTSFEGVEAVDVRGRSIGKGFAGTIKRHNFRRGPRSHGSKNYRAPGSIGAGTTPGRVLKGKRMAGHMGDRIVTLKNLSLVKLDSEKGLLFLKGAVPGKRNALVEIFS
jgi:large subunit ribosomal protein L3